MRTSMFRRGRVWWANYRHEGRRFRTSLETENRKIAEDLLIDLELSLRNGKKPEEKPKVTVAEFKPEYEKDAKARKRPKSHVNDMARLQAFLDFANPVLLEDITTRNVSAFLAKKALEDGAAPATLLRHREILHAFCEVAVRHGHLEKNPVSAVPRPRLPHRVPRFLGKDQIEKLLAAVKGDRLFPVVATLVFAGLRREETCWLTPADLDLGATPPVLRVRAKTVDGESWLPKNKRDRTVPVSSRLAAMLAGPCKRRRKGGRSWLFPSPHGHRQDPDNLSRRFRQLMKKARLPWSFLELRHTFGSQLAQKGVSLLKIATLMGNSPAIAQRHYIQLVPEEMAVDVEF